MPASVYKLDVATGRRDLWKKLLPPDPAGVYSLLNLRITPDGKVYCYSYARLLSQLYVARNLR